MHSVAETTINGLEPEVLEFVARRVLRDESAALLGDPAWSELSATHADNRTLAILRVAGTAATGESKADWSAVVKLIDTSAKALVSALSWVDPKKEEAVYENGLFIDDGLPFRPAKCYLVSRLGSGRQLLWLEDLTEARGTPFTIPELKSLALDIGHFNGHIARYPAELPFEPGQDSYLIRWKESTYPARLDRMANLADPEIVRRMHANTPRSVIAELYEVLDRLALQSLSLPHTLSFGDCNAGNMFRVGNQTVAIDWASLTMDPTGVDAGCLIGAASTWGPRCAEVAAAERDLFECYLAGLDESGWNGNRDDVRRGFFGQFGHYLMNVCIASGAFGGEEIERWRGFFEARFETTLEDLPDLLVPIIDMAPRYLEEVRSLLD